MPAVVILIIALPSAAKPVAGQRSGHHHRSQYQEQGTSMLANARLGHIYRKNVDSPFPASTVLLERAQDAPIFFSFLMTFNSC